MTALPPAEPSPRAQGDSLAALAAQVADLRGQIRAVNARLDQAGLGADLNLAARFDDLAKTVADALEAAAPRGPAAPCWIGLDRDTYQGRLAAGYWGRTPVPAVSDLVIWRCGGSVP